MTITMVQISQQSKTGAALITITTRQNSKRDHSSLDTSVVVPTKKTTEQLTTPEQGEKTLAFYHHCVYHSKARLHLS